MAVGALGGGSDDTPLWISLSLPSAAVLGLFGWAQLDAGLPTRVTSLSLVLCATVFIYGVDRWRDRARPSGAWLGIGAGLLVVELWLVLSWWPYAHGARWTSVAILAVGQLGASGYAGFGEKGKGLKHVPGMKALVVASAVSVACVGMLDAFGPKPDPWGWWSQRETWSRALFILALAGCNAQLFDLRDVARDARSGVPSAAVLWGVHKARVIAGCWLVVGVAASLLALGWGASLGAYLSRVVGMLLGLWLVWDSRRSSFAARYFLTLDGALVVPWLVAWLLCGCGAAG